MNYFVYYLLDPVTKDLLYIGRSNRPSVRQRAFHSKTGLSTELGPCQRFSDFDSACQAELRAIKKHLPPFNKSVQSSKGRYGKTGIPITDWHRKRLSEAHTGKVVSEETRSKQRSAMLGRKLSPETKAKVAAANLGKKQSPETISKRMAAIARTRSISTNKENQ